MRNQQGWETRRNRDCFNWIINSPHFNLKGQGQKSEPKIQVDMTNGTMPTFRREAGWK